MKTILMTIISSILLFSCSKKEDKVVPNTITLNGTTYNNITSTYTDGDASSGTFSTLTIQGNNTTNGKILSFSMVFNTRTRPTAGSYIVAGDTGTPASTPLLITIIATEKISDTHFLWHTVHVSPSQLAITTDNGKLSVELPALTLNGMEFENDLAHPVGSSFNFSFGAHTFTEQ